VIVNMSWFWGHIFPGTGWFLMALFHFLQALKDVHYLKPLRVKPSWICFRSLAIMVFSIAGSIGEIVNEWDNWGTQQVQHLTIWAGFFLCGLIEYLHINNILIEHFWCILPPIGMSFVGVMLTLHEQKLQYWKYMHEFSGQVTIPLVVSLIYTSITRLTRHQKSAKNVKLRVRSTALSFRNKTIEDLNPIYTEQTIYDTVLPCFNSFLLCLQGVTWYEMAVVMGWRDFHGVLPPEVPHAAHAFLAQVIFDIFVACLLCATTSWIARAFEKPGASSGDDLGQSQSII